MSCHGCATKFGVFTKEKGCTGCGFSFCKKCLRFKAIVPKVGSAEQAVCRHCYESLTNEKMDIEKDSRPPPESVLRGERDPASFILPNIPSTIPSFPASCSTRLGNGTENSKLSDALVRRLESLENPARPPITVYHHNPRMEELKTGLTAKDREIAERLERLKEERKRQQAVPTEEDIVRRLAALKGEDSDAAVERKKKPEFFLPDTRSDEEKTNALIKQLLEEQMVAAERVSRDDLIAKRLARLRGEVSSSSSHSFNKPDDIDVEALAKESPAGQSKLDTEDVGNLMKLAKTELDAAQKELKPSLSKSKSEEDEKASTGSGDSEIEKIIQRAVEEAALPDVDDDDDDLEGKDPSKLEDPEELPWCTICNDDATKRCLGCDGFLYCSKCFTEFHDDEDMKDHKSIPFSSQDKK